ncbi:MAG: putative monovalent cation/H+ antiporter subunit A [Candidatus Kapabacteria bacterium]|nr:putative monovalent cation/H+ antiporter subunit A [Ignavibacteriota bacterium]MCW5886196.1 putative monovalent cation/H+ antiporter subunit A [Candidatus Kapabacteria bacterium]
MFFAVTVGILVSVIVPFLFKVSRRTAPYLISLVPLGIFLFYMNFYPAVSSGEVFSESHSWFPSMDINLLFRIDGLALLFALIISGIGISVFFYAAKYMSDYKEIDKFYIYILIFMSAMLGVVTSDNFMALFVFWELTSISSFLLIGFNHDKEKSRYAALQALLVTALGGLAMLGGFIVLANIAGTYQISQLVENKDIILNHDLYELSVILILAGAFTKSAQFPFHFWLPNAMEAPTPVSAYLHSATMVKAGIFLLARLNPSLSGSELWSSALLNAGALTMIMAIILSIKQSDLKKILAYTTLSVLGTLTMLIGIGGEKALAAMAMYLLAHSLYKAALFLLAGIIDHETGTRNIDEVGGMRSKMKISFSIGILASISMMGILPLFGFIAKEAMYDSVLYSEYGTYLIYFAVLAGILNFAAAGFAGLKPFIGKFHHPEGSKPHEAPVEMWLSAMIPAALGLIIGLLPGFTVEGLINSSAGSALGLPVNLHLSLWHGFNTVLILSLLTIVLGTTVYLTRSKWIKFALSIKTPSASKPSVWYDYLVSLLQNSARLSTVLLQNGNQRNYISIIMLTVISLTGISIIDSGVLSNIQFEHDYYLHELIVLALMVISTIATIKSKGRLTAVASIGVLGFAVSLTFIIFSAPDLAMTQFAVETLTVILFVLVLYKLPKFVDYSSKSERARDLILSITMGVMVTLVILLVLNEEVPSELKSYYANSSYILAKGRNIVNVILVDFRALDTLGEITVLSIAALGVYALLRLNKEEK